MKDLNEEIAEELLKEEEARIAAEFAPKTVERNQVKAAKFAWIFVALSIDAATAYLVALITGWFWYGIIWFLANAGGLVFAEWLWERVGNNKEQTRIAEVSKNVSAASILLMAVIAGVAYVLGWMGNQVIEVVTVVSTVGLFGFHGWQAYQYHEKDDDYIAATEDARAEAENQKDIRRIHRAAQRVSAKKVVHLTGAKYEAQHGKAFNAAAGRSFAQTVEKPELDERPNERGR